MDSPKSRQNESVAKARMSTRFLRRYAGRASVRELQILVEGAPASVHGLGGVSKLPIEEPPAVGLGGGIRVVERDAQDGPRGRLPGLSHNAISLYVSSGNS